MFRDYTRVSTSPYYDYDERDHTWLDTLGLKTDYVLPRFFEIPKVPCNDNVYAKKSDTFSFSVRDKLVKVFAWAIPNNDAIAALAKLPKIVEVGAGNGYWSHLVKRAGGDITPFDTKPWLGSWTPVQKIDNGCQFLHKFKTLFLCWPPYDDTMAFHYLSRFNGEYVAYVGEGHGGCTGDDAFHALLDDSWEEIETIDIPQWYGVHDRLYIFKRKG